MRAIVCGQAMIDYLVDSSDEKMFPFLKPGKNNFLGFDRLEAIESSGAARYRDIGGSATNTFMTMKSLGAPCFYIGTVGNDNNGDFFSAGIGGRSRISRHDHKTGMVMTFLGPGDYGRRTNAFNYGAADYIDVEEDDIGIGDILYASFFSFVNGESRDRLMKALYTARKKSAFVVLDCGGIRLVDENVRRDAVSYSSALFANENESGYVDGAEGGRIVVHRKGADGSVVVREGIHVYQSAVKCDVVNTLGAGDVYNAAFLTCFMKNMPLGDCANFGALMSSRVVSKQGTYLSEKEACDVGHGLYERI